LLGFLMAAFAVRPVVVLLFAQAFVGGNSLAGSPFGDNQAVHDRGFGRRA